MKTIISHISLLSWTIIFSLNLSILILAESGFADKPTLINWQTFNTEHTIIHYQDADDLVSFNAKVNFGTEHMHGSFKDKLSPIPFIKNKIDALFKKSQYLLDMQGFTNKIHVKVFKDKQQLENAFNRLYKKKCNVRAWYLHEKLTVYIQLGDIHEGILAHEFAHAVIDHYMIVPPPDKTAEVLAQYVEKQLKIDSIQTGTDSQFKGYSVRP